MKNSWISIVIVAVVVGGAAFWGGMTYAQSSTSTKGGFGSNVNGMYFRTSGTRAGGANAAFGTIIAKDATSITVQLGGPNATSTNGTATGSKIVLYDGSTQIEKTVAGSSSDLSVGQSVVANGTANSDGSITAQTIQIRPAGAAGARAGVMIPAGQ